MPTWRKVLSWETARTVEELQPGDDCWVVPSRTIQIGHDLPTAEKMEYWDKVENWQPAKFIEWIADNDALISVNGINRVVHRFWLRTQGTPTGQHGQPKQTSLRWETTEEVPSFSLRDWRNLNWQGRQAMADKLAEDIEKLREVGDPSIKEYTGYWSGYASATANIWARNGDEATILARTGHYDNWDEQVGDEFDFSEVSENG